MSMVHADPIPAQYTLPVRLANAAALACRRAYQAAIRTRAPRSPEDLEPSRMSRASLIAELMGHSPYVGTEGVRAAPGFSRATPSPGEAAIARRLAIARELLGRDLRAQLQDQPMMEKPELLAQWLQVHCAGLDYEVFFVVYLTAHHHVIAIEPLFRGTLTQTTVYPREVVKGAITNQAAAVAFAHNHPSGSVQPSRADEALTQTLKCALAQIDVRVIDHLVIAGSEHYSFAQHGLI